MIISDLNKSKVIIQCEKCGATREVSTIYAKRYKEHICRKCANKPDNYKRTDIVVYTCINCSTTKEQLYHEKRYYNWLCSSCKPRKSSSQAIKDKWNEDGYREKQLQRLANTKDIRSKISKDIWSDPVRLKNLSDLIKSKWENKDYRDLKTAQSRELWANEEYIRSQKEGMNKDSVKERLCEVRLSQLSQASNIQRILYGYLDDLNVQYHKEGELTRFGYYVFDCLLHEHNIAIECQGDYWHSIPKTVSSDRSKFTYMSKFHPDIKIVYIWEHEFYTNDKVINKLKNLLNIESELVDFSFSDVIVRRAEYKECIDFIDAYHYLKDGRSGTAYGAFIDDKMVACAVLSNTIRQNCIDATEISRFVIHPNYQVKNFASWMLSRVIKIDNRKQYLAFADSTVGHSGTIYKAANFTLHHEVEPDYWYMHNTGYSMHKKTLYNRAVKMSMTEKEYADKYNYTKRWGGKKYCFTYGIQSNKK